MKSAKVETAIEVVGSIVFVGMMTVLIGLLTISSGYNWE